MPYDFRFKTKFAKQFQKKILNIAVAFAGVKQLYIMQLLILSDFV